MTITEVQKEHEEEAAIFYACLGKAVARWASVEWALSRVFWHALGRPDDATATSAFFSNHAFYAKLQMVNEPLTIRYGKTPLATEWAPLHERLRRKSKVRNDLAHAPVAFAAQQSQGRRLYLNIGSLNPATRPTVTGKPRTTYYATDLRQIEAAFTKLANDVSMFEYLIERLLAGKPLS